MFDLHRHGGLREMQFLCRAGVTEMAGNRLKYLQLPYGDVHSPPFFLIPNWTLKPLPVLFDKYKLIYQIR